MDPCRCCQIARHVGIESKQCLLGMPDGTFNGSNAGERFGSICHSPAYLRASFCKVQEYIEVPE